jgi:hypothetical protein
MEPGPSALNQEMFRHLADESLRELQAIHPPKGNIRNEAIFNR